MAIVIVLVLAMGLLILGSSFIVTIRQQAPVNPLQLANLQADLLGQGITQIALLKFKELPGPFYYASIAKGQGNTAPYLTFVTESLLRGTIPTPFPAAFNTDYEIYSSKMYEDMNLKIQVVVSFQTRDGQTYQQVIEHVVNGLRYRSGS
jgi:hypothetical protein